MCERRVGRNQKLFAVGDATDVFARRYFSAVGREIFSREVMVDADFGPAHAGEKAFRHVSAGRAAGILDRVSDALRQELGGEVVKG